jgi:hypothetical protein
MIVDHLHKRNAFGDGIGMTANQFLQSSRRAATDVPRWINTSRTDKLHSQFLQDINLFLTGW